MLKVILIPVCYSNARKICERFENTNNETLNSVLSEMKKELVIDDDEESDDILCFELTDFMDSVNNQELDNLTEYFITYLNVKTKEFNLVEPK